MSLRPLLLAALLALAWAGPAWAAVRPVEELRLLTDAELRAEAVAACVEVAYAKESASRTLDPGAAVFHAIRVGEWSKYLDRIGLVVRERSWWGWLTGRYPRWWEELRAAANERSKAMCLAVGKKGP